MSCPHSLKPESSPSTCSLCAGVVVERRALATIPEGDPFEFEFVEPNLSGLGMATEEHREVSRRGGLARAAARRPHIDEEKPTLRGGQPRPRPEGAEEWLSCREICERYGVTRRSVDRARVLKLVTAVASEIGGERPTYFYEPESVETWISTFQRRN